MRALARLGLGLLLQHFLQQLTMVVGHIVGRGVQVPSEGAAQVVLYCGVYASRGQFPQSWKTSGWVQYSVEVCGREVGHQAGGSTRLAVVAGVCVHCEAFLASEVACVAECHVGVVCAVVALHVGGECCNSRVLPPHFLANL